MALTQISTGGIKDDAVTDAKLPANSVGNSEMKDDAVGVAELSATGTPSSSTFLRGDNSWVTPTDTNTQLAFANDGNNRVVTGDGSGGLNGEANLTFDGTTLKITDTELAEASDNFSINIQSGNNDFYVKSGGTTIAAFKGQNKHLEITDGDLVIGTSGHGIDFSATSHASGMSSETLDSYEEGTYTATLTCLTSGTITVNSSNDQLYYTKIGRVVYVTGRIRVSAVSSPNGAQLRLNLPIVSAAGTEESGRVIGWVQVQGAAKDVQDYTSQPTAGGNTYIQIGFSDNTIFTGDICGDINTSTKIAVNFHYVT